jgi:hypothetical protein
MSERGVSEVKGWLGVATQLISLIGYLLAAFGGASVAPIALPVGVGAHLIGTRVQAKASKIGK